MQCADKVNAYHVEGRGWVLSGDELNVVEFRGQHCNIRCGQGYPCCSCVSSLDCHILARLCDPDF